MHLLYQGPVGWRGESAMLHEWGSPCVSQWKVSRLASRDLSQVSLPNQGDCPGATTWQIFTCGLGQDRALFPQTSRGESRSHDLQRDRGTTYCAQCPRVPCHATRESSRLCCGIGVLVLPTQGETLRLGRYCGAFVLGPDMEHGVGDARSLPVARATRRSRGQLSSSVGSPLGSVRGGWRGADAGLYGADLSSRELHGVSSVPQCVWRTTLHGSRGPAQSVPFVRVREEGSVQFVCSNDHKEVNMFKYFQCNDTTVCSNKSFTIWNVSWFAWFSSRSFRSWYCSPVTCQ